MHSLLNQCYFYVKVVDIKLIQHYFNIVCPLGELTVPKQHVFIHFMVMSMQLRLFTGGYDSDFNYMYVQVHVYYDGHFNYICNMMYSLIMIIIL